jgi:hypothetical protein
MRVCMIDDVVRRKGRRRERIEWRNLYLEVRRA